jgi:hypothetical protein
MSLVGEAARVSAAVRKDEEGEVMVSLAGGTQAYPARAYDPNTEFVAGERVLVLEEAGRVLYIGKLN